MKEKSRRPFIAAAFVILITTLHGWGLSMTRTVSLTTEPPGATVKVDGVALDIKTPVEIKLKWESSSTSKLEERELTIELANYETETLKLSNIEVKTAKSSVPIPKQVILKMLVSTVPLQFVVDPKEATIKLPNGQEVKSSERCEVKFFRPKSTATWGKQEVTVSCLNYASKPTTLTYESVKANPVVQVTLEQIRKELEVELKSNESDSIITINGKEEGKTPLRKKFVFDKVNGVWSTTRVEISKNGYRQKLPSGQGTPGHTLPCMVNLGIDSEEVKKGELVANLEKVLFLPVPVYALEFNEKGPYINPTMELSETVPSPEACTMGPFGNVLFESGSLIQTKMSPMPDGKRIVLSLPRQKLQATEGATNVTLNSEFSMNICIKSETPGLGSVTDRPYLHLDPCVDKDGEWVYFASNSMNPNRLNIWRKRVDGKSGYVKVTDSPYSIYDREPAISPDGKRLLYVSLQAGMTQPQIWICNPDGTAQTLLCPGENPSWSSDGTKIAFIAPDSEGRKQVWVMSEDGSNAGQLTFGNSQNKSPLWAPGDKNIIYCANRGLNQENRPNWDIWVMDAAGQSPTQLTQGGSYDDKPAISPDGNYIYFLTNRGASKKGVPFLQIWRLEWKNKSTQTK